MAFGTIDMDHNDVQGIRYHKYPAFKFYPTKKKYQPIEYSGAHTADDIELFIRDHKTVPFVEIIEEEHGEL